MHELQAQYTLTSLSKWGEKDAKVAARRDVLEPIEPQDDPLGPFKTLNAMLEENPPPAHHAVILNQFARIGIGPGLDVETQPDAVKQGLIRAELIGMALLKEQFLSGDWANIVNAGAIHRPRPAATGTISCFAPPASRSPESPPTTPPRPSTSSTSPIPTATS